MASILTPRYRSQNPRGGRRGIVRNGRFRDDRARTGSRSGGSVRAIVLGTSSAIPTFKRALSATVLERDGESFMFDCGEGTQFQFMRAGLRRGRLRTIFVTHLHGDHFYGLPGFLSSLNLNQREEPIDIYGPQGLKRFVDFVVGFPRRFSYGYEIRIHELEPGFEGCVIDSEEFVVRSLPLDHRLPTHGYRFEEKPRPGVFDAEKADELGIPFGPERGRLQRGEPLTLANGRVVRPEDVIGPPRPGKAFAYVTDTAICLNAKRLAQDCDLLIHESTYGDEMLHLAFERKHTTMRQAATIARAARARRFVATHFSTRYDRDAIAELEREGRIAYPDLVMAKDLLEIEF